MFDFDRVIERRDTHASKWDNMQKLSGIDPAVGIPMWVADMDFAAPPGVVEALRTFVDRGTYGYYADTGSWAEALAEWMRKRHGWTPEPSPWNKDAQKKKTEFYPLINLNRLQRISPTH